MLLSAELPCFDNAVARQKVCRANTTANGSKTGKCRMAADYFVQR